MENKKGADLPIGAIIVIILGLAVLVVVLAIWGTTGGNLAQKIFGLGGDRSNIQTNIQACQIACSSGSIYDYCKYRKVIDDQKRELTTIRSCQELAASNRYGLESCSITCSEPPTPPVTNPVTPPATTPPATTPPATPAK